MHAGGALFEEHAVLQMRSVRPPCGSSPSFTLPRLLVPQTPRPPASTFGLHPHTMHRCRQMIRCSTHFLEAAGLCAASAGRIWRPLRRPRSVYYPLFIKYANWSTACERPHYKTPRLGPRLGPRFDFGPSLGEAVMAQALGKPLGPRHHQGLVVPWRQGLSIEWHIKDNT